MDKIIQKRIQAQRGYCQTNRLPYFAPVDGVCWVCGKQIYEVIPLGQAQNDLIISCPYCHYSFCD